MLSSMTGSGAGAPGPVMPSEAGESSQPATPSTATSNADASWFPGRLCWPFCAGGGVCASTRAAEGHGPAAAGSARHDRRGSVVHDRWRRMECRGRRGRMELWRRVRWRRGNGDGGGGRMELLRRSVRRCSRPVAAGGMPRAAGLDGIRCVAFGATLFTTGGGGWNAAGGVAPWNCWWPRSVAAGGMPGPGGGRSRDRPRRRRVSSARRHRLLECRPGRRMELRRRVA